MPDDLNETEPSRPGSRRRRVVWIVATLVVIWLVVAALQLVSAGLSARSGLKATDALRNVASEDLTELTDSIGGSTDDVDEENAAEALRDAADDFSTTNQKMRSLVVQPLYLVPVLGRQLRSVEALSDAAATTASEAATAVEDLEGLLEASTATSSSRVESIDDAEQVLVELQSGLAEVDLGPTEGLIAPLAEARNRFAEQYNRVTETLDTTLTAVAGTRDFLTGPTNYLLLASNNAEMRAGSGMVLQVGPMSVNDGTFEVGEFSATDGMFLESAATAVDPDIEARWGSLVPAQEWRNTNLSPRFDQSAATAAAMWEASGGEPVEGVISVDVQAIAKLLEVTGPVQLPTGETIAAETVVQDLLVDQYRDYGEDRDARRERLGQVAQAVFDAINERPVSASDLMSVLRELGAGRNLMMWSSVPVQQDAWEALGTDGTLAEDSMMLSVMNRGGNKLDPYISVVSAVTIATQGDLREVQVDVVLSNGAPEELPPYVSGPYPFTDFSEGEYKGIVALTMPGGAGDITIAGGSPAALGDDGPTRVAATEVRLLRGAQIPLSFRFYLPVSWKSIEVLPSARIPPTQWSANGETWTDDTAHVIELDGAG